MEWTIHKTYKLVGVDCFAQCEESILECYQCSFKVEVKEKIGRQTTCSKCGRYLHCCLNCRFYSPAAYHQCCETQAEWVSDKQAANFCDYFEPAKTGRPVSESRADKARKKLDQLFKSPGTTIK